MPLRDRFRSPGDDQSPSGEFHGGWPMVIVQHLLVFLGHYDPTLANPHPAIYATSCR